MRKFFSKCGVSAFKIFMTLAMLVASTTLAKADSAPVALTPGMSLELGVTYSFAQYSDIDASFTSPADGVLRIEGIIMGVYSAPGGNPANLIPTRNSLSVMELDVTKGQTIYFYNSFVMDRGTLVLYMDGIISAPLEIKYMQPDQHEIVDYVNYSSMQVTFNQDIKVESTDAQIVFQNRLTSTEQTLTTRASVSGALLNVPMYSVLNPYIAQGAIRVGDRYKVIVKGITTTSGQPYINTDANGNAVFSFLCGSIPTISITNYCPDPFLSYWPKGTPEGILKMTFDKPLGNSPQTRCEIGWGNQEGEAGEYYFETLPIVIDGNSLTVDFTGVLRTPSTMTPLFPDSSYPNMAVNIVHVVDEFGNPVNGGSGSTGSFSFYPVYKVLSRSTLAAEFEPANGSDLSLASKINVWISGIKDIKFDGFKIDAVDKVSGETTTYVIPMSDVTVTPDGDDAAEYAFNMPEEVINNAKSAVVTLNNIEALDGYNHNDDIRASYGGFVVTYADPANGTEMPSLDNETIITIETNVADKYPAMYVEYQITDLATEEIIKSISWLNRQEDGSYSAEVVGDYKLLFDHDYKVEFTAWEDEETRNFTPELSLGSDYIIWKGLTPPYRYSDILLSSITPDAGEILESNTITVNFEGMVNLGETSGSNPDTGILLGMGMGIMPFAEVTPVTPEEIDGTIYSSSWNLVFPDGYLNTLTAPVAITLKAFDEEGRVVKGEEGEDAGSYFIYQFDVPGMFKDIAVSFGTEPVTSVREITVSFPTGINVAYEIPFSEVKVYNKTQQEVAYMEDYIMAEDPENPFAIAKEGRIVLNTELTEEGGYMLHIPRSFFELGTDFNTAKNSEVNLPFSISAAPFTVIPAQGKVESLETIVISYNDGLVELVEGSDLKPYYNIPGNDYNFEFASFSAEDTELTLTFDTEITQPGTYIVTVPEGLVRFVTGGDAPAVTLTYTISEVAERPNLTLDPEEGPVSSIPQVIRILFNDYDSVMGGMGKATLSINGGEPEYLGDVDYDFADERLNLILQPTGAAPEYTEKGTYVFSFPAGYFSLNYNGEPSPAFDITYTIGESSSVDINIEAASYTVFNLTGVKLLDRADREAYNALAPGLYIVNGVKIVKK